MPHAPQATRHSAMQAAQAGEGASIIDGGHRIVTTPRIPSRANLAVDVSVGILSFAAVSCYVLLSRTSQLLGFGAARRQSCKMANRVRVCAEEARDEREERGDE